MDPDYIWTPSLSIGATFIELPKPIEQFTVPWLWNFKTHEVPLKDGVTISSKWKGELRITIGGRFAFYDGEDIAEGSEVKDGDIFLAVEAFRTVLDSITASTMAELFLFHDTVTDTYRKFRGIHAANFEVDMGDPGRTHWPYTLQLLATDPAIYTTEPGAEDA